MSSKANESFKLPLYLRMKKLFTIIFAILLNSCSNQEEPLTPEGNNPVYYSYYLYIGDQQKIGIKEALPGEYSVENKTPEVLALEDFNDAAVLRLTGLKEGETLLTVTNKDGKIVSKIKVSVYYWDNPLVTVTPNHPLEKK